MHIASPPKPCAAVRTTDTSQQDDVTLVTTMNLNDRSRREIKNNPIYFIKTLCWCCCDILFQFELETKQLDCNLFLPNSSLIIFHFSPSNPCLMDKIKPDPAFYLGLLSCFTLNCHSVEVNGPQCNFMSTLKSIR